MKKFTRDSETVGLLQGQVNEIRPSFVDDIVITNHLSSLLSQGDHTLLVPDAASPVAVSDPDESFGNKIHFCHFTFFFVNDLVVSGIIEPPRHEPLVEFSHEIFVILKLFGHEPLVVLVKIAK